MLYTECRLLNADHRQFIPTSRRYLRHRIFMYDFSTLLNVKMGSRVFPRRGCHYQLTRLAEDHQSCRLLPYLYSCVYDDPPIACERMHRYLAVRVARSAYLYDCECSHGRNRRDMHMSQGISELRGMKKTPSGVSSTSTKRDTAWTCPCVIAISAQG